MTQKEQAFYIKRNMAIILCYQIGKMNVIDLAKMFRVSRSLIYKIVK